ncbi:response regulator transcription factor [Autumnicola psychrophila]|uniref:Response regulator transcription factor n=1 Tax=Autumnicola psychrophila TaxID=3075592 RepID=A0ABU3DWE7_9FLAO|nr:response regulator transcription factor [Zunongwangia sp. F225]MDT0688042.1 response regulator transcription factor [Zunongwangia sp. F225]
MKKIFLVEDDHALRELIGFLLTEKEYEVKAFPTVTSFTKVINKELPDVIVMDIMLPDGNGVDLCKSIREEQKTRDIPVLLMSAHANPSIVNGSGANSFLAKPFDVEELYKCIEQIS